VVEEFSSDVGDGVDDGWSQVFIAVDDEDVSAEGEEVEGEFLVRE